jgi:hypothetical protein
MAYSDWDISGGGTDVLYTSSLTPVYTDRPALNQTVYGPYSRHLTVNGNNRTFAIKNSVAGGAFTGIPDNQGVRLECTFYSMIDTMFNRDITFSLYAFTKNCHLFGISNDIGYIVGLVGSNLLIYLNNGANYQFAFPSNAGPGIPFGQWQSFRLDILPVDNKHVLKIYSEMEPIPSAPHLNIPVPGNGNWVQASLIVHNGGNNSGVTVVGGNEIHISNTSPAYAPYNASSRSGIRCDNNGGGISGGLVDGFKIQLL